MFSDLQVKSQEYGAITAAMNIEFQTNIQYPNQLNMKKVRASVHVDMHLDTSEISEEEISKVEGIMCYLICETNRYSFFNLQKCSRDVERKWTP